MTILLAIDASEQNCSVSLSNGLNLLSSHIEHAPRKHAELILPMIDSALSEAQKKLVDVEAITFTHGPGAFTGIRICTAAVQGLAFVQDIPVIPISTLELIAYQAFCEQGHRQVLVALDARMNEIYFGAYRISQNDLSVAVVPDCVVKPQAINWQALSQPKKVTGNDSISGSAEEWFGVGSGWCFGAEISTSLADSGECLRLGAWSQGLDTNAAYLAPLALARFKRGELIAADKIKPVYLRDSVAWNKVEQQ